MKTKIIKAIVWIIYALFVGVLIYGAILRTNAISAERGFGGNEAQYSGNRWENYDREGFPAGEARGNEGRFGSGDRRGYYDREVPQLPDEGGYVPFNGDHQPRRGQGDGWMREPDHRFGPPFREDHQYKEQPRRGQGDGWKHEPDHRFGPPFRGDHQYDEQPRDGRGRDKWFYPSSDEELNDYAERYLDIDDLLEKAGEK